MPQKTVETKKEEQTEKPLVSKPNKKTNPVAVDTINVNFEDEVTFILDKLEDSKDKRVLISIPEGSDLLVSTVSLELLAEAADKKGKKIVVVTDDEAGKSLARSVGITVRGAVSSVDDMAWKEADIAAENREEEVKVRRDKAGEVDETELIPVESQFGDEPKVGPIIPMDAKVEDLEKPLTDQISGTKKVQVGDFEMMVDSSPVGASTAAENMEEQIKPEILRPSSKSIEKGGFVGRDFSKFKLQGLSKDEKQSMESELKPLGDTKSKMDVPKSPLISPIIHEKKKKFDLSFIKNLFAGKGKKKIIAIIALGLILLFTGGTFAAARYLPEVIITLEVDSISVEYSGEITANVNEDGIDEDDLVVPAKTEEVEKNGSDSATTTGIEYKGEKATGAVLIYNKNIEEEVVLNAGTVISNGGVNFVTKNSVVLPPVSLTDPATMGESDIEAQKIGDQYNLVAGTQFTVSGFNLGDVYAVNVDAFKGGSEEELKVVAQADINGLAEKIKKTLDQEAGDELKGETDDSRWVLVEDSLEQKLKGDAKSSAPAGAEATTVDVSIETTNKALYYDSNKLDELIETLLLEDYKGQIETFEVSENMEKIIEAKSFDLEAGTVTLQIDVSGYVMPQLDDDKITGDLVGKSWTEGIKYLEDMDYVSDKYKIEFLPTWMPEILWRMPVNKDRISVKVKNIAPEESSSSSDSDESDTSDSKGD